MCLLFQVCAQYVTIFISSHFFILHIFHTLQVCGNASYKTMTIYVSMHLEGTRAMAVVHLFFFFVVLISECTVTCET
uniref:Uncharacterized protein n=1 Tax=Oryza brachyantha TaxID=4533 RepID=J3NBJ7_ORYBR